MMDVAVALRRYSFLGPEFLTWLWFAAENEPQTLEKAAGEPVTITVGNRIVAEKRRRDLVERVAIRGEEAQMEEGLMALKKGALVTDVNLELELGDSQWRFSVKGDTLAFSAMRTPATGPVHAEEELEGAVLEKAALIEKPLQIMERIFFAFIRARMDESWNNTRRAVRKWLEG
jgi:hypothetical protein